jgi:hypothetical protein
MNSKWPTFILRLTKGSYTRRLVADGTAVCLKDSVLCCHTLHSVRGQIRSLGKAGVQVHMLRNLCYS